MHCNYQLRKKLNQEEYGDYLKKLNKYYYDYNIILYTLNKNMVSRLSFYSNYLQNILLERQEKNTNFNLSKYFEDDIVKLLSEKKSKPNKGIFNSLRQYSLRQYRYEILFFNKKFLNKFIKDLNSKNKIINNEYYNIFRKITFLRFYFNYTDSETLAKRFNQTKKINYIVDDNKTFKTFLKKNQVIFEKDDEYKEIIDSYIKDFDTKDYKTMLNKSVTSKNKHFENIKLLRNTIYENTNKIIDYYIVLNIDTKDNLVNFNIKNNTNISTKNNNKIKSIITGAQSL